jgi:hypothetical protein
MKRLISTAMVAIALGAAAAPAFAEVKTRERSQVKFEGMLGRMFSLFGGKGAKEGVEGRTAVKGNRKATLTDNGGTIVDLSEEKVYELDMRKKQYTVTTFDELRRRMREAQDKAKQEAQKEEPGQQSEPQKPTKEYEVDFDVKDTGQKKQIAGYDAKNTVVTITVREKGKTLEDGGGIVMTNDMWLGPQIKEMKELSDFGHGDVGRADGRRARHVPARRQGDGPHAEGLGQALGHPARHDDDRRIGEEQGTARAGADAAVERDRRRDRRPACKKDDEEGRAEGAVDDLHDSQRDPRGRHDRCRIRPRDPAGLQGKEVGRTFRSGPSAERSRPDLQVRQSARAVQSTRGRYTVNEAPGSGASFR